MANGAEPGTVCPVTGSYAVGLLLLGAVAAAAPSFTGTGVRPALNRPASTALSHRPAAVRVRVRVLVLVLVLRAATAHEAVLRADPSAHVLRGASKRSLAPCAGSDILMAGRRGA